MSSSSRRTTGHGRASLILALAGLLGSAEPAQADDAAAPVIKETPVPDHALPRFDATLTIPAPMEKIWALISDCRRMREVMDLESSELVERHGKVERCKLVVDLPFPFGKLRSIVEETDESRPGLLRQSWKLVSGDYLYDEGFWELSSPQPGSTLVRYVGLTEPKLPVPRGMLTNGQRDYIVKMLLRLRQLVTH
jgi:hypothetical protein